ncbi:hypothetical protein IGI04_000307 [Brassica rapa subsp. trilocularis]|uniref:DYW domain-containing protein n=1 Tax=Brassica rapa subsp. trilocularis TaxID=1813537 RepID=A0ABQ7NPI1_BRACM|nr:hypothetical protein IGI04_000307 [Brassica rapa subsp. trilocularis]
MSATSLARCSPIYYSCDACKCVSSSQNHQTNENRNLVTNRRSSKPNRLILHNRSKNPNDPSLTRALREFADSGLMEDALHLFDEMNKADVFVWNVMIKGFTTCGLHHEALRFYSRMVLTGIKADSFTYPFVIKSAAGASSLLEGKTIQAAVIKLGFDSDVYVCNSLISFYMKLGWAMDAEKVFDEMPERDIVSWNSIVSGFLAVGDCVRSLVMFKEMMRFGFEPDRFSIMSALGACSHVEDCLRMGKEIHCYAIRRGIEDVMVLTSVLDMYNRYSEVSYAERVFNGMSNRNIVAWNVMIGCYARNGRGVDAFLCFQKMSEGPDVITLINLLPACEEILEGRAVHGYATRRGFLPHVVLETALIDMYGEGGKVKSAEAVFDRMGEKNLVSWNSMIAAYVQNGENYSALKLFRELWDLDSSSLVPDSTTIASILPAYAESLSLSEGRQLHAYVVKARYSSNTIVLNSLVHMYAMCGDLGDARKCFDQVVFKDVVSWNSIIMAYGVHGFGRISVCLFSEMITTSGVSPNKSTFASLLAACSISGMIDEGWDYFNSMKREYGIDPGIEHYVYMVDLIGRTGNLSSAKRFIEDMPFVPTARVWGSLLKASRNHNDITVAEFAAEQVLKMEHDNTGCYVLLLNMYSEAGRWEDVDRIKLLMKSQGVSKTTSCSTVVTRGRTHVFTNGDRSHVETNKIYEVLDIVSRMVEEEEEEEEESYVHCVSKMRPETLLKKKRNSPRRHSVRLATCLGLISTETGRAVVVRNNTRICRRCHEFLEKASKVTRREIVVGDSKIFHHFSNGCCSCGNYW